MMKRFLIALFLIIVGAGASTTSTWAQKYPERREIRTGNRSYGNENYSGAETSYRRALEKNPASQEAAFNLSDALYKQERYDEAAQTAAQVAADTTLTDNRASAYYNQGNALFKQRKLEEALEAYKNSMRLNPDDQEAKFNYAYTKKLLEEDKNDKGGGGQDQNQDKNQDKNKDQQDKNDQQNQDQQDKQSGQDEKDKQDQKPQDQQQSGMNKEEAERMLDAMQANEDNTKKKVDEQKVKAVGRSGKNW